MDPPAITLRFTLTRDVTAGDFNAVCAEMDGVVPDFFDVMTHVGGAQGRKVEWEPNSSPFSAAVRSDAVIVRVDEATRYSTFPQCVFKLMSLSPGSSFASSPATAFERACELHCGMRGVVIHNRDAIVGSVVRGPGRCEHTRDVDDFYGFDVAEAKRLHTTESAGGDAVLLCWVCARRLRWVSYPGTHFLDVLKTYALSRESCCKSCCRTLCYNIRQDSVVNRRAKLARVLMALDETM